MIDDGIGARKRGCGTGFADEGDYAVIADDDGLIGRRVVVQPRKQSSAAEMPGHLPPVLAQIRRITLIANKTAEFSNLGNFVARAFAPCARPRHHKYLVGAANNNQ